MGEILLIRHGQANSAATDEAGYDQLSPLGAQQATWLGGHLRRTEPAFDHVISGSLKRHRQTAEGLAMDVDTEDARWNELDYFNLADAYEAKTGEARPSGDGFAAHIPKVMQAWHRDDIRGNESFAAFEDRVTQALTSAALPGRRTCVVTSGGVIGMVLRQLLGLDALRMAHVLLPILNTSVHRIAVRPEGMILAGFNGTPHLDEPDRVHGKTFF